MTYTEGMSSFEWVLIYVALGLSTVINIIVPVSGSAVVTPLLALLTDPYRAIGIASFFFFLSAIVRAYFFRRDIQWNEVRILFVPSVVAALVGALAVVAVPEQVLLLVILLFSIYFLLKKLVAERKFRRFIISVNRLPVVVRAVIQPDCNTGGR